MTSTYDVEEIAAREQADIAKLEVIYGEWWPHYALPDDFRHSLYLERSFCPYCESPMPPAYTPRGENPGPRGRSVIDHMDPLKLGGENSPRNAVMVCATCNKEKGSMPFPLWLKKLPQHLRDLCHSIYVVKHGHFPEEFIEAEPTVRVAGCTADLVSDIETVRRDFPAPIVAGPPQRLEHQRSRKG